MEDRGNGMSKQKSRPSVDDCFAVGVFISIAIFAVVVLIILLINIGWKLIAGIAMGVAVVLFIYVLGRFIIYTEDYFVSRKEKD